MYPRERAVRSSWPFDASSHAGSAKRSVAHLAGPFWPEWAVAPYGAGTRRSSRRKRQPHAAGVPRGMSQDQNVVGSPGAPSLGRYPALVSGNGSTRPIGEVEASCVALHTEGDTLLVLRSPTARGLAAAVITTDRSEGSYRRSSLRWRGRLADGRTKRLLDGVERRFRLLDLRVRERDVWRRSCVQDWVESRPQLRHLSKRLL